MSPVAGEADRSIGLIMPFSSTQMKALCLRAQPWTFTFKAFSGCSGCVQCCGWGLYNLAALGNYKDKWREAESITHLVRKGGLRLGNFVFFESSPHPPWPPHFTLFLLLACVLVFVFLFFSSCGHFLLYFSPSAFLSIPSCPHPLLSLFPFLF